MICLNGRQVEFTSFPDGTTSVRVNLSDYPDEASAYNLKWNYDGDHECILLWYIVNHIRSKADKNACITLEMPYIPNARMDRVKQEDEVFTLKWFADFINIMKFDEVFVVDPHSNVATALLNNVDILNTKVDIEIGGVLYDLNDVKQMDVLFCYPDEGAAKRYSEQLVGDYVFCVKHRDWRSGKIEKLELTDADKVAGRNILIVDDICSKGGTFTHTAKALKDAGAKEIFLYVTHCENTIEQGTVLTDGLISHVFTTDSIYRGSNPKITLV